LRIRAASKGHETPPLFNTAKQIQGDLEQISAQEVVGTGLHEIEKWTGIKVDCFVNFLMDFSDLDERDDQHVATEQSRVRIEPIEPSNVVDESGTGLAETSNTFQDPTTLASNAVRSSYPPSVDIEAAIRNDALDVGVFGPQSLVSNSQAELLIQDMCRTLSAVLPAAQPRTKDIEPSPAHETSTPPKILDGPDQNNIPEPEKTAESDGDDEDYDVVVREMGELRARVRPLRAVWPRPLSVLFGGWRS